MPENNNNANTAPVTAAHEPAAATSPRTTPNNKTGPTSTKQNTFFPGEHGLMLKSIGHKDGQPVDTVQRLYASLVDRFGVEDPVAAITIELAIVDYWRLGQGHLVEKRLIDSGRSVFEPKGWMPTIIRYNSTARRNLEESLQLLQAKLAEAQPKAVAMEEEPETSKGSSADSDPSFNSTRSGEPNIPPTEFTTAA